MKKHTFSLIALAIAFVAVFAACKKDEKVAVASVTLNESSKTIVVDSTLTLTPTILPENATNKTVTWSTSDAAVATVANGIVTAVGGGTATITVTTEDGNKTAICEITVTAPHPLLGTISFATAETWTVGDQEWSDAVQTTYCSGKEEFDGGDYVDDVFNADCRSNPNQKGDLFSWEMVNQYGNVLCPDGWRVPTREEFAALDIALGGTGNTVEIPTEGIVLANKYFDPEKWGGSLAGYTSENNELQGQGPVQAGPPAHAFYWSNTASSADSKNASCLHLMKMAMGPNEGGMVYPNNEVNKSAGHSLRCVRDL